jgi:hypothetical protein
MTLADLGPAEARLVNQLAALLSFEDVFAEGWLEQLDQLNATDREAYLQPREDHYRHELLIALQDARSSEQETRRDGPFDWLGTAGPRRHLGLPVSGVQRW